jgi:hypothetical protein
VDECKPLLMGRAVVEVMSTTPYPDFDDSPLNSDIIFDGWPQYVAMFQRTREDAVVAAALLSEAARGRGVTVSEHPNDVVSVTTSRVCVSV